MEGNSTTTAVPETLHHSPFSPSAVTGAVESQARVSALLEEARAVQGVQGDNVAASAPAALTPAATPAPAATRRTRRNGVGSAKHAAPAPATPATPTDPSVSITLPKEVYDYFAAEAEKDERTLAKFVARIVRADYSRRIREAATEAAARGIFNSDATQ